MIVDQFFTGRLVDDPELRFTPQGSPVARFRIAESNSKKNPQGGWDTLDRLFLPVELWGAVAEEVAGQLHKGDQVWVRGQLRTHEWESRDGSRRSRVEVRAWQVAVVLSSRQQTPASSWAGSPQAQQNSAWGRRPNSSPPTSEYDSNSKVPGDDPPF